MKRTPESVVGLLLLEGHILAVSRKGNHVDLGFPGGKLDPGETPEQALRREILEETGVTATSFVEAFEDDDGFGRICRAYWVPTWEGEAASLEKDAFVGWVEPCWLLEPSCSFRDYNQRLFNNFERMGMESTESESKCLYCGKTYRFTTTSQLETKREIDRFFSLHWIKEPSGWRHVGSTDLGTKNLQENESNKVNDSVHGEDIFEAISGIKNLNRR